MKSALVLFLLACVIVSVMCIVCPPDFCEKHPCVNPVTPASCKSPAVYRDHHSFCGCCPECVVFLNEGEHCIRVFGVPLTSVCNHEKHLQCIDGVCTKVNY